MHSDPNPPNPRGRGVLYSILIEHPQAGLILWETGGGKNYEVLAGHPAADIFHKIPGGDGLDLDKQVELCVASSVD